MKSERSTQAIAWRATLTGIAIAMIGAAYMYHRWSASQGAAFDAMVDTLERGQVRIGDSWSPAITSGGVWDRLDSRAGSYNVLVFIHRRECVTLYYHDDALFAACLARTGDTTGDALQWFFCDVDRLAACVDAAR